MQVIFINRKYYHLRVYRELSPTGYTLVRAYRRSFFIFYKFLHQAVFENADIDYGVARWIHAKEPVIIGLRNSICDRLGYARLKTRISVSNHAYFTKKTYNHVRSFFAGNER